MKKELEVVKPKEVALVEERHGFEEAVDMSDLIMPMAKLYQGTPTEQEEYPNAKPGQLINSLTQDVLPTSFIPVFKWTEWAKFNPRNAKDDGFDPAYAPGALIWKTLDKNDPRTAEAEFGANGEKPTAMKSMRFLCRFDGVDMPVIVSFSKTSYNAGKKLLSLAQFSSGNMYSRKYKLMTKKEQKDGNSYYVMTVSPDGIATPEEQAVCAQWYRDLRGKNLTTHDDAPKTTNTTDAGWTE